MGRHNRFAVPYLELRPETATYVYSRRLTWDQTQGVFGEVERSWTSKDAEIGGKSVIKIALGSKDPIVAMRRWSEVHAQVERLIATTVRAEAKHGNERARAKVSLRSRLGPKDFAAIETQIEHGILAELDKGQWDRQTRMRKSRLELMDLEQAGQLPTPRDFRNAEMSMHHRDEFGLRGMRQTIVDAVAVGHVLPNGQLATDAPSNEDLDWSLGEMDFLVGEYFSKQGVEFGRNHPDYLQVGLKILQGKERANARAYAMVESNTIEAPPLINSVLPTVAAEIALQSAQQVEIEQQGIRLSEAHTRWRERMRPSDKTAGDYNAYVLRFASMFGDLPVKAITRKHIRDFREALKGYPRNVPQAKRGLPMAELIVWAKEAGVPKLAVTTINDRAIAALSAVIGAVADDEGILANPCDNQKMKVDARDVKARVAYEDADLERLLKSLLYTRKPKISRAAGGVAAQWLPLIAMFTGARLEEIGQLRHCDILKKEGMWFFDFETLDATPGQTTQRKTESSRRLVPVHPTLRAIGFLDFVETRRSSGRARLFHELTEYRGKLTTYWSKWWGRWARRHVATEPDKCFHSFRHLFKNRLVKTKCEYVVLQRILGHAIDGMSAKYGDRHQDLEQLDEAMRLVSYPALEGVLAGFKVPSLD